MSQCHAISTEVTLNPPSHTYVTFDFHALPVKQQEFLKKGIRINLTEHRPFTKLDFKHMSDANWRKFIQRTKSHLELVINSHPRSWKVKGITLPGDSHRVTLQDTRIGLDFLAIVESLKLTSPTIHDIKIQFKSDLHECMKYKGYSVNPSNNSILINYPTSDPNIKVKILVQKDTSQIDIACSYNPIIYSFQSILRLHELLSKISYYLEGHSGCLSIPPVDLWVITHYHFAKDGQEINGQMFHMTFEEVSGGMLRLYSKRMPDGIMIPRLEQIKTERLSVGEQLQSILDNRGLG